MQSFHFFEPNTFEPENHSDFAKKLQCMLENPAPSDELKHIAANVHKQYSWKKSASIFHNLLTSNLV